MNIATGIGNYDWWEDESDSDQQENRGQSRLAEARKAWKYRMFEDENEDGNANP